MSKFGWDLPPGVTANMLPGNSVEDAKEEALIEALYEALIPLRAHAPSNSASVEAAEDDVVVRLLEIMKAEVAAAYASGQQDEAMAQRHE